MKPKPPMADFKAELYKNNHLNRLGQAHVDSMAAVGRGGIQKAGVEGRRRGAPVAGRERFHRPTPFGMTEATMTGTVQFINRQRGMVAIATDQGYTIIELIGDDEIDLGNTMRWANDTGMGGETYQNVSKGKIMDVYVQNHFVPPSQLRQQLLMG